MTRKRVKLGSEIGGGLLVLWSLVQWGWRLIGDWQQVDQAVADWPGFVRWLGAPQTGPILVIVALLIYLIAVFWPEPSVDPLVGKFFHTFHDDGGLQYQGYVIREKSGRYFVQLFEAMGGTPSDQRFMTDKERERAVFYGSEEDWHEAYERWARRHQ